MPHSKSAMKRLRQNRARHLCNKATLSYLHTLKKKFIKACEDKKTEDAGMLLKEAKSSFQKAAKHGVIHRNNAGRNISRLCLRLARLNKPKEK